MFYSRVPFPQTHGQIWTLLSLTTARIRSIRHQEEHGQRSESPRRRLSAGSRRWGRSCTCRQLLSPPNDPYIDPNSASCKELLVLPADVSITCKRQWRVDPARERRSGRTTTAEPAAASAVRHQGGAHDPAHGQGDPQARARRHHVQHEDHHPRRERHGQDVGKRPHRYRRLSVICLFFQMLTHCLFFVSSSSTGSRASRSRTSTRRPRSSSPRRSTGISA